jgi:hypothetical protein
MSHPFFKEELNPVIIIWKNFAVQVWDSFAYIMVLVIPYI